MLAYKQLLSLGGFLPAVHFTHLQAINFVIIGIKFSSFVPEPRPTSPTGVPTGYQPAPTNPIVPVHNQQVNING